MWPLLTGRQQLGETSLGVEGGGEVEGKWVGGALGTSLWSPQEPLHRFAPLPAAAHYLGWAAARAACSLSQAWSDMREAGHPLWLRLEELFTGLLGRVPQLVLEDRLSQRLPLCEQSQGVPFHDQLVPSSDWMRFHGDSPWGRKESQIK